MAPGATAIRHSHNVEPRLAPATAILPIPNPNTGRREKRETEQCGQSKREGERSVCEEETVEGELDSGGDWWCGRQFVECFE
jgi:hypothetical protein